MTTRRPPSEPLPPSSVAHDFETTGAGPRRSFTRPETAIADCSQRLRSSLRKQRDTKSDVDPAELHLQIKSKHYRPCGFPELGIASTCRYAVYEHIEHTGDDSAEYVVMSRALFESMVDELLRYRQGIASVKHALDVLHS